MNDADKRAFMAWYLDFGFAVDSTIQEAVWQAACEWRDSQVGEPVKAAKYFAISDLKEIYLQRDYLTNQLEIYEEENDVPKDILDGRKIIPVYISKHPPAAQINQHLAALLKKSLHWLDGLCDAGPLGQQYPSDELTQFLDEIKSALNAAKSGDA